MKAGCAEEEDFAGETAVGKMESGFECGSALLCRFCLVVLSLERQ
jgi:hypothetical protein